jgi:DNA (cytosine-5)-methyltransferase 1
MKFGLFGPRSAINKNRSNNINLAVLDLFAGCGGLSQGFKEAGFEVVAANEFWKPAADTYEKNHKGTRLFRGDITSSETKSEIIDFFRDKNCDVIIGGPPCQAYSVSGLRKPDDPRGKLFEDYMQLVKTLKPNVFVMENVRGILSIRTEKSNLSKQQRAEINKLNILKEERAELLIKKRKSRMKSSIKFTSDDRKRLKSLKVEIAQEERVVAKFQIKLVDKIKRRFNRMGYSVEHIILNAADYGVPQTRERVIFIGKGKEIPLILPKRTHTGDPTKEPQLKLWVTVREAIDNLKERNESRALNHLIPVHSEDFVKKIDGTPIGKSMYGTFSHAFFKPDPDKPSITVKENHGSVFLHYEKRRSMTPRELARLQSFRDSYRFYHSKQDMLTLIGNAVPPKMARALAFSVREMLNSADKLQSNN